MTELTVKIGIGDWHDEYVAAECDLSTMEKALTYMEDGHSIGDAARLVVVQQELGQMEERLLKCNLLLFYDGARSDLNLKMANQKRRVMLENGKEIQVRAFVAPVPEDSEPPPEAESDEYQASLSAEFEPVEKPQVEDTNRGIVSSSSELGTDRARHYLMTRVPGYVYGRLAILAAGGADVRGAADQLVGKIYEMVAGLE